MKIAASCLFATVSAVSLEASASTSGAAALLSAVGHRNVTHMQSLVQSLAEESIQEPGWKFDDDIKAALHAIRDMFVKSIQHALIDEHKQDQEHMNCFTKECFAACNVALVGDEDRCHQKGKQCEALQHQHVDCRTDVYASYKSMAQSCGALHCYEIPDDPCPVEDCLCPDLAACHRKIGNRECRADAGDCKSAYGVWLQEQLIKYRAAYDTWDALHKACKSAYHEFLTVDMSCDATQKEFEQCMCEKNRCDWTTCAIDFTRCSEQCWARYDELVTEKDCLEKDRKIDWSATKKIECYVDVLLHDYSKQDLISKCGTDDCINKAREIDYKHCATVCPEVDHDGKWPTVLSVEPGNVKVDGHARRSAVSQYLLGDGEYKCDLNGADKVFTNHRSDNRAGEARCTEHLDIDYQVPECLQCDPESDPICDAAFHKKYYYQFDDTSRIDCISDCCSESGSTCFNDVTLDSSSTGRGGLTKITLSEHSHAWAYNRCECEECQGGFPVYAPPPENHQCGRGAHTLIGGIEEPPIMVGR